MRFIFTLAIAAALSCAPLYADYKEDVTKGNAAYRSQNWAEALSYYIKAYKEQPSKKLYAFIMALEKKAAPAAVTALEKAKPEKPFEWAPVLLCGLDLALCGAAGYMYVYENRTESGYNAMYAEINGTTRENYERLMAKQREAYNAMMFETLAIGAAGTMAVYTVVDLFFTHGVFKQEAMLKPVISPEYSGLMIERRF